MRTQITVNTRQVPVEALHELCRTCNYGDFNRTVRRHYDPLYKMPMVKDGRPLFIVDAGDHWLLVHARNEQDAQEIVKEWPDLATYVEKELITTPPSNALRGVSVHRLRGCNYGG